MKEKRKALSYISSFLLHQLNALPHHLLQSLSQFKVYLCQDQDQILSSQKEELKSKGKRI